jgi:6-phospho-3-hexuloisomerase
VLSAAQILAVTTRADSTLAGLAQVTIELPTSGVRQFGGTLFEQSALLVLDALVMKLTEGIPVSTPGCRLDTPTCSSRRRGEYEKEHR